MVELFPAQVEQKILEVTNRLAKSPKVREELQNARDDAQLAFEVAWAEALVRAEGAMELRKAQATLETADLKLKAKRADSAFRYGENTAKTLESEQSTYQSLLRSVLATYGAAGVGER